MKTILSVLLAFVVTASLAQTKKELKEQKRLEDKAINLELINNKTWVLEVNMVYDKQMNPYNLSPVTNFIMVEGDELTVQMAFQGVSGWNGIGGITMDGTMSKYEIKENKEAKPVDLTIFALGSAMGNVTLFVSIDSYKQGRVTYTDVKGTRLTFNGQFFSYDDSRVYKSSQSY
jgi:hypothetical protein